MYDGDIFVYIMAIYDGTYEYEYCIYIIINYYNHHTYNHKLPIIYDIYIYICIYVIIDEGNL